jgi:hypothetical protein
VDAVGPSILVSIPPTVYMGRREGNRTHIVQDISRETRPFLPADLPGGYYILYALRTGYRMPQMHLGLHQFRHVVGGAIDPALLFILRQVSWFNMPVRFRAHSISRVVEWGDVVGNTNDTGVLIQLPREREEEFSESWFDSVRETFSSETVPIMFAMFLYPLFLY